MKKLYISCYENSDAKYKKQLIEWNRLRNNTLFEYIESKENDFYMFRQTYDEALIDSIKKHVFKDADVAMFLVGLDTHKRKTTDWEARAAIHETTLLKKCGIIVVYLPEVYQQYGEKIPRTLLPKIIQKNIINPNAYVLEITWNKIAQDINNLEKFLNVGFAYGQMSKYVSDSFVETSNQTNVIFKK